MPETSIAATRPAVPLSARALDRSQDSACVPSHDDRWWLEALRRRDEAGLRCLIEQYGTWIYGKAYRMLASHEDAEEAWQDIFMRIWQKIDLWDPDRGNFQSWLNQIAKNAVIDIFRKRCRVREVLQQSDEEGVDEMLHRYRDEGPLPDEVLQSKETRELIEQALELMTKKNHRIAWSLRHLDGMSIAEIGEILEQKENTVKVWIFRGTRELRQIMRRRGFDFDQFPEDSDDQA